MRIALEVADLEYLTFGYNTLILMLYTIVATGFALLFLRDRRKVDGWCAVMFVLYFFDNIILYMTEAMESFSRYYDMHTITSSTIKTVISILIFYSYARIIQEGLRIQHTRLDIAVFVVYIWALVFIPLLDTSRFSFWLYFTMSQLLFAYLVVRIWRTLPNTGAFRDQNGLRRFRRILALSMLLNLAVVVEDMVVIFLFDQISPMDARIQQRNLSEDVLSIYFSVIALRFILRQLKTPPSPQKIQPALPGQPDLRVFGEQWGLTPREQEVLQLIVDGKTNQQISEQLFITLGTTKNHVHNIYQKCEVVRRSQLLRMVSDTLLAISAQK